MFFPLLLRPSPGKPLSSSSVHLPPPAASIKETFSELKSLWEIIDGEFVQMKTYMERQMEGLKKEYSGMDVEGEKTVKKYLSEVRAAARS